MTGLYKKSNQIRKLKASILNEYTTYHGLQSIIKYRKNIKVTIVKNHIACKELLRHNVNPNKVHQEARNCNTSDPENVAKTRDQSVLSDLSDSDFYSGNDEVLCTILKNRVMEMVNKKNRGHRSPSNSG